tara:strand:- start:346 stop:843 length:498 start_codon:yes stop_codon:yes gene_type:complete
MNFLPNDYELPKATSGGYVKLQKGDTILRFLGDPITGYEWWESMHGTEKPVRCKDMRDIGDSQATQKAKHFWACCVWSYDNNAVQIWQINQRTIQDQIHLLINDPDWGDPRQYDLKITRIGEALETKYTVSPKPKKDVSEAAKFEFELKDIKLEKLYTGEDPFEL